jgi:hypothetical protein
MENALNQLINILTKEQELFQQYLDLLTQQQEHLVHNDLDSIRTNAEKINVLVREAADLENSRRFVLVRISQRINADSEKPNLTELLSAFEGPRFKNLERFKDTIFETYNRINEQKARNELLIDQSIKMISQAMQFIHRISDPAATYENPSVSTADGRSSAVLVSRMI